MVRTFLAVAGLALSASTALAAPLNLIVPVAPNSTDVTGSFPAVSYNAATKLLTISGASSKAIVAPAATGTTITPDLNTWTLTATINNDGTIGNGGLATLLISGKYPTPASAVLFSGTTLSQFGYNFQGAGAGAKFEFVFTNTGGTLNPLAQSIGVVVADTSITATNFSSNFSGTIIPQVGGLNATGDAFIIPAPASAALMGLGGLVVARRRR